MADERRVRPTLRCAAEDLGLNVSTEVNLDVIEHPFLEKARNLAASHPQNEKRIEAITERLVYRFTHGRYRVVTWLDSARDILWVCAAGLRHSGSGHDIYAHVERLRSRDALFPNEDDDLRDAYDEAARFIERLQKDAPDCIADAASHPLEERIHVFEGSVRVSLFVDKTAGLEEIWLAVAAADIPPRIISTRLREMVFAIFQEAAEAADWEPATTLGPRSLKWYEVAKLGIRESR